jgi:hypothetical protein
MSEKPKQNFYFFGRDEERRDSPLSLPPVKGVPKLKEVHTPYIIYLKSRVLGRLVALLQAITSEFGFVLRGKLIGKKFLVTSLYVPPQEVSGTYWEATDYTKVAGIPDIIGWGHSHNSFGAFHSGTDIDTAWSWAKVRKVPICSLTISTVGEWDARVFLPDDTYTKAKLIYPGCQIPQEWKNNIKPRIVPFDSDEKIRKYTRRWLEEDWAYG